MTNRGYPDLMKRQDLLARLTSTESCAPCQDRASQAPLQAQSDPASVVKEAEEVLAQADAESETDSTDTDTDVEEVSWTGILGIEGELTGDGRLIEKGALRWENLPLPLRRVAEDNGAHDGAVIIGQILTITRQDDGSIAAAGTIDTSTDEGATAASDLDSGKQNGVSLDLDDVSFEIRVKPGGLEELPDAEVVDSEDGKEVVLQVNSDDEVMVSTSARIRAATIVAIPAFDKAVLTLGEPDDTDTDTDDADKEETDSGTDTDTVTAAGSLTAPPSAWFLDPHLEGPTPLTVSEEGRVHGHLAAWHTCHIAQGHNGGCLTPPHSPSGYAYFQTGAITSREGVEHSVGRLTMDTSHAAADLPAADTTAHYDYTGAVAAEVAVGEDAHGIWVAGALRPGLSPAKLRAFKAAPLSGDWRTVGGQLELVAALSVNVAGFPIPRPRGRVASGRMTSLAASGMLAPRKVAPPGTPGALSADDIRYLKRLASKEREAASARPRELNRRVRASSLALRAHSYRSGQGGDDEAGAGAD